jgi:hypothetical protein
MQRDFSPTYRGKQEANARKKSACFRSKCQCSVGLRGTVAGARTLGFFAEEFDVGWAFFYRGALAALDLFADLLDDVGIG